MSLPAFITSIEDAISAFQSILTTAKELQASLSTSPIVVLAEDAAQIAAEVTPAGAVAETVLNAVGVAESLSTPKS